jgi:hypothetical protein
MATTRQVGLLLPLALVLSAGGCSALLDTSSLKGGKLDTGRDASPDRRKIDARIDRRVVDRTPPAPDLVVIPEGKVPDKTVIPEAKAPDKLVIPEAKAPDNKIVTPELKVPDSAQPDAAKPDAPKPDAPKPDAPKPDAPQPDAAQPDAPSAQG